MTFIEKSSLVKFLAFSLILLTFTINQGIHTQAETEMLMFSDDISVGDSFEWEATELSVWNNVSGTIETSEQQGDRIKLEVITDPDEKIGDYQINPEFEQFYYSFSEPVYKSFVNEIEFDKSDYPRYGYTRFISPITYQNQTGNYNIFQLKKTFNENDTILYPAIQISIQHKGYTLNFTDSYTLTMEVSIISNIYTLNLISECNSSLHIVELNTTVSGYSFFEQFEKYNIESGLALQIRVNGTNINALNFGSESLQIEFFDSTEVYAFTYKEGPTTNLSVSVYIFVAGIATVSIVIKWIKKKKKNLK